MTEWDPKRNALGQFVRGSGGRPPGATNRVSRKMRGIFADSMDNISGALELLREADPGAYLRIMLKAIPTPRHEEVQAHEQLTIEQADAKLHEFADRLLAAGYGSGRPALEAAGSPGCDGAGELPGPAEVASGQPGEPD